MFSEGYKFTSELVIVTFVGFWGYTFFFFLFLIFFSILFLPFSHSMEELTSTWNNLSLNEREGSKFTLQNQHRSAEFIVAAKFLTKRVLNMEVIAKTFRQL